LYQTGFSSQAESSSRDDGLTLTGVYIAGAAHCAPPDNKPSPAELANCRPYLERELDLLKHLRVVVALGRVAFDTYLRILRDDGQIASIATFKFGHGAEHRTGPDSPVLIGCYHPSQQNTSTGKLTATMLRDVFERARQLAGESDVN
jgi:uracil-DNA glycosylase family 4